MANEACKKFRLWEVIAPFILSVALLGFNTWWIGDNAGTGYNQIALLAGACLAIAIGWRKGVQWKSILLGLRANIRPIFPTLLFLLLIGAVSVTWLLGGIIPTMIYYGIKYLSPSFFLVSVVILSGLMGLACGSSWLTIGTMGVAFLGIGEVLGFPKPLVAGAIISGAYFGDKLTPLSETTVLAASMTGTPLMRHVRSMLWTSIPTFVLTLGIFACWNILSPIDSFQSMHSSEEVMCLLEDLFDIRALWLLVPVVVMAFTMLGCPPLFILTLGMLIGGGIAFYAQWDLLCMSSNGYGKATNLWWLVKHTIAGVDLSEHCRGNVILQSLLHRGGIWSMWSTITIILASVVLSGAMEGTGLLHSLMQRVQHMHTQGQLVLWATVTAIFCNLTVADQYLAIILTSKIFTPLFKEQGYPSEVVSRTVEDAATVTSPLIAWNTCGAMQSNVLGVSTLAYLPYCFFNLLSPCMSVLLAFSIKKRHYFSKK